MSAPAVREFSAHFLQIRVAHVLHCEDENILKVVGRLLHIGKQLLRQFLALLVRLGQVYDLGALRLGHGGGGIIRRLLLIDLAMHRKKFGGRIFGGEL